MTLISAVKQTTNPPEPFFVPQLFHYLREHNFPMHWVCCTKDAPNPGLWPALAENASGPAVQAQNVFKVLQGLLYRST